jgi:hypothetical protein
MRRKDREGRAELAAQDAERNARPRRDVAEADLFHPVLGEQRHESRDDILAVGTARRQCGRCGLRGGTLRLAGHGDLLSFRR